MVTNHVSCRAVDSGPRSHLPSVCTCHPPHSPNDSFPVYSSGTIDLGYRRYKLVVQTVIGENNGQGVRTASRCLWDTENDNFASASFANTSIFAVAMVFGLYYE
eukprot:TRINITY_DN1783_c0_g1_i1.p1 TRINITY_DN1783_c0_g1~~TRINITY_DN1783_c0_g1_i1.p1  ORF type:complete len:104 (-),score=7.30 TRINITY_DN1783_c0_g1_i1:290-601(-)